MFLITTADQRFWKTNEPVLFLGEWCKLFSQRAVWEKLDCEVLPYHWDDRKKLHRDYLYLQGFYEELLQELAEKLNEIHCVNHTLRYWRILVGPWLGYFVPMLFDRWEMIQRAVNNYSLDGVQIIDAVPEQVVPNDMIHFNRLFIEDAWNEAIYGQLLQGWTTVPIEKVQQNASHKNMVSAPPTLSFTRRLKQKLVHIASFCLQIFTREDEAFFIATYLPIEQDFYLQLRLGQISKFWYRVPAPQVQVDWPQRQWQVGKSGMGGFPAIVRAMIPRHIPALYIEGYTALRALCDALPWPKKPRLIVTSNSHEADDVFKAWASEKVEAGAHMVVGQHGGNYGIDRWNFAEEHECTISNSWLSWGWDDEERPQIKPVSNLKMVGVAMEWDPDGNILMVACTVPRYSYRMFSVPVATQWLDYFEDQCRFVAAMPERLRNRLLLRLHEQDYGWCQKQRLQDRFPEVRLDDGRGRITPLIKKARIYVSTYNATTFLESLALNIPTIMFWNPSHWELRDSAVPYFERLKAVGIFHETPEAAAHQMTRVWDNVAVWWNSETVQTVRKEFCHRYSRMPERPLDELEQALLEISYSTKSSTLT